MLTRALCAVSLSSTRGYACSCCQPVVTHGLSLLLMRTVYLTAPLLGLRRVPRLAHDLLLGRLSLVKSYNSVYLFLTGGYAWSFSIVDKRSVPLRRLSLLETRGYARSLSRRILSLSKKSYNVGFVYLYFRPVVTHSLSLLLTHATFLCAISRLLNPLSRTSYNNRNKNKTRKDPDSKLPSITESYLII